MTTELLSRKALGQRTDNFQGMKNLLEAVEELALEAGQSLREEFYRAGGPRGSGDKADIDEEIEAFLSERLRALLPGSAVVGEELGESGPEGAEYCWLVDPHDGTSAFLRGFRGSSVSVGLIHHHQPVLGVVYAPLYPNDSGDMISGGPGLGLRRQREPLQPVQRSGPLTERDIVVISQDADQRSEANALVTAPARFLGMPSIAYRLALTAIGDARVGQSLVYLNAHDVAAGHALLMAAGKRLFPWHDDIEAPIVYRPTFDPTIVLGGDRDAVVELRKPEPREVLKTARTSSLSPLPASRRWKAAGLLLERAQGVLLGQVAGDSLGSLVEFKPASTIASLFQEGPDELRDGGVWHTLAGQPTDDGEMMLALARQLIEDGVYREERVFASYRRWRKSDPFDIGRATSSALEGAPIADSQANGSLMRCSPLGLVFSPLELERIAPLDSSLTHPHALCRECCRTFTQTISRGVAGAEVDEALEVALAEAAPEVQEFLREARSGPPREFFHQMGWIRIAFVNAFSHLYRKTPLRQAVIATVRQGGDTDTNGAIVGALLGAFQGLSAVPEQWRLSIQTCRPARALRYSKQPRPREYWPVDVLNLAELLLEIRCKGLSD